MSHIIILEVVQFLDYCQNVYFIELKGQKVLKIINSYYKVQVYKCCQNEYVACLHLNINYNIVKYVG